MVDTTRLTMTKLEEGGRQKEAAINTALDIIDLNLQRDMGEFVIASLPSASANPNSYAIATDASGGRTIVRSDGTNWKIVAVELGTVA